MNDKVFEQYRDIVAEIEALELKKETLKEKCLKVLEKENIKTLQQEYGTFSFVERKIYHYSEDVMRREKELKEEVKIENEKLDKFKEKEIIEGIAKVEVVESFRYTPVKIKKEI